MLDLVMVIISACLLTFVYYVCRGSPIVLIVESGVVSMIRTMSSTFVKHVCSLILIEPSTNQIQVFN